jgi:hypothetical protein
LQPQLQRSNLICFLSEELPSSVFKQIGLFLLLFSSPHTVLRGSSTYERNDRTFNMTKTNYYDFLRSYTVFYCVPVCSTRFQPPIKLSTYERDDRRVHLLKRDRRSKDERNEEKGVQRQSGWA